MSNAKEIVLPAPKNSHFIMFPFIADDELDPYESKLLTRYIRLSWGSGKAVDLGGREGCRVCHMSRPKFYATRQSLHDKGYIILTETELYKQSDVIEICWERMWERNAEKYQSAEQIGRDLTAQITSGKLNEDMLYGILSSVEQMLGMDNILSRYGTYIHQGGQNIDQEWPISLPHLVNIQSVKEESILPAGSAEPPAAEVQPRRGDYESLNPNHANRAVKPEGQPEKKNIKSHPLTLALVEARGSDLATYMLNDLQARITGTDEDGGHYTYPSLIDLYDNAEGFPEFVAERISNYQASNLRGNVKSMIGNLRNVKKSDGKWLGWLGWKDAHPELTLPQEERPDPDAPAPVVIKEVNPESVSRFFRSTEDESKKTEQHGN